MRYAFLLVVLLVSLAFCSFDLSSTSTAADDGKEIYLTYCKSCHGKKGGSGIGGAAKLTKSTLEIEDRIEIITNGKGRMTPFGSALSKKEIAAVAEYTMTLADD